MSIDNLLKRSDKALAKMIAEENSDDNPNDNPNNNSGGSSGLGPMDDREALVNLLENLQQDLELFLRYYELFIDPNHIPKRYFQDAWDELNQREHFATAKSRLRDTSAQDLERHGLTGKQLRLKLFSIKVARENFHGFIHRNRRDSPKEPSKEGRRTASGFLRRVDVVLDSASQLPLVGSILGAIGEFKKAVETELEED